MQSPESMPRQAIVDLSVIGEAFEHFKNNAGTWIAVTLITGIIQIVISGIMQTGQGRGGSGGNLWITLIGAVISIVVNGVLYAGLFGMAIKQVRGQQVSIGDLFSFTDVLGQTILASIIVGVLTGVGFIFCFFPGLVVAGLFMFTLPLIVDKKMNASEAVSASMNALKSQWLMSAVFVLVAGLLYMFGYLLCFVGVLITAPVALLSVAVLYRNFFIGSSTPPSSGQTFEPAIPPGG